MKKILFALLFLPVSIQLYSQFSIGADLVGLGFSNAYQREIGLTLDTALAPRRIVFFVNSSISGAYRHKQWEFSLGLGYGTNYWKQKFNAPTDEVKAFLGSNTQSDSSDYLAKITFTNQLVTLPIGVKYLMDRNPERWVTAFVSLELTPGFTYNQTTEAGFFNRPSFFLFPFRTKVEEDAALVALTEAYFDAKTNHFLLDSKFELGMRIWGRKRKFCVDLSLGYSQGLIALHQQMGLGGGYFGNLGLRFFLKNREKKPLLTE